MSNECGYDGCIHGAPVGHKFCIFHQPMDNKSVYEKQFMDSIDAKLRGNDYNCRKLILIGSKFNGEKLQE